MPSLSSDKITCIASVYSASSLYSFISDHSLMSLLTQGCLSRVFGCDARITMADTAGTGTDKSFIVAVRSWGEIAHFKTVE